MAITSASSAAQWLLWFAGEHGDGITNLKLQKLLYYAQGWYLALKEGPLFDDRLEAWPRGPVQPQVYRYYKHDILTRNDIPSWQPIPPPTEEPEITADVKDHIEEILDVYGGFSAYQLEDMTHQEPPWKNARGDLAPLDFSNNIISVDDMKIYFTERANESQEK